MTILLLLIPLSLMLLGAAVVAFIWAVRKGQFDDDLSPAVRILNEPSPPSDPAGGVNESK